MLDDVRVVELPEDLDFSLHLLEHTLLLDLFLIQNFDSYFVSGDLVESDYRLGSYYVRLSSH